MRHDERRDAIVERLRAGQRVGVASLARDLSASVATIRRDLEELEEQRILRRIHGGAVPWSDGPGAVTADRPVRRLAEKRRIAAAAVKHLRDASTVGFTGGTTTGELARQIGHSGVELTAFTTGLNIALELATCPQVRCIISGGEVRGASLEVVGPSAEDLAGKYHLDLVFVGVDGLTAAAGASGFDVLGSSINHVMIEHSSRVIVVTDSTKLGHIRTSRICAAESIDLVITDVAADPLHVNELIQLGVEVEQV